MSPDHIDKFMLSLEVLANYKRGTRQICSVCAEFTGRCEDDTIWSMDNEPLCETCGDEEN